MKRLIHLFALLLLLPMGMVAQQPQKANPGIVAHRGFHRMEGSAENSIFAMQQAVAHDFEGTEFDVQITSDGVAIVYHDGTMQGCVIRETPYDTLRQLSAFTLKNGETVPLLDAFMEACSQTLREQEQRGMHTRLFFEIKELKRQEQRLQLLGQIIETIGKYGLHDDIFFISFDLETCMLLAQLMPDIPVAYLEGNLSPQDLRNRGISDLDCHWHYILEHPEWVEEAHSLGMSVNVWTVDDAETARRLRELGVDFITTNDPMMMRTWLGMERN